MDDTQSVIKPYDPFVVVCFVCFTSGSPKQRVGRVKIVIVKNGHTNGYVGYKVIKLSTHCKISHPYILK